MKADVEGVGEGDGSEEEKSERVSPRSFMKRIPDCTSTSIGILRERAWVREEDSESSKRR